MALRDTSWVVSGGALVTANSILLSKSKKDNDQRELVYGNIRVTWKRSVSRVRRAWICLTEGAASTAVDTMAADTTTNVTMDESNRILGAYEVTVDIDSVGAWSLDTWSVI